MVTSSRSRSGRAVRVLAAAVGVVSVVWIANLVFIARNDAAKGWFDCGVHCTTTQNVAGGHLVLRRPTPGALAHRTPPRCLDLALAQGVSVTVRSAESSETRVATGYRLRRNPSRVSFFTAPSRANVVREPSFAIERCLRLRTCVRRRGSFSHRAPL